MPWDLEEFAAVSATARTSTEWFPHSNGVSPVMCDIAGDSIVDIGDYTVLSGNFSEVEVTL